MIVLPAVNVTFALPPITTRYRRTECVAAYVGLPDRTVRFVRCRSTGMPGTNVTGAVANFVASDWLVAVTVTTCLARNRAGRRACARPAESSALHIAEPNPGDGPGSSKGEHLARIAAGEPKFIGGYRIHWIVILAPVRSPIPIVTRSWQSL